MAVDTLLSLDGYVGEEPVMAVMSVMSVMSVMEVMAGMERLELAMDV